MTIRPILLHPDPRLKKATDPVARITPEIEALAADMLATMYDAPGIGLAGPQVGVLSRIFVMDAQRDPNAERQPMVLINPEIVWASAEKHVNDEGCLSVPGIYDGVERFDAVHVRALDGQGQSRVIEAEGLLAVCIQHEMDHLMGKVFVEYLSPLKRGRIKTKLLKQQKQAERV